MIDSFINSDGIQNILLQFLMILFTVLHIILLVYVVNKLRKMKWMREGCWGFLLGWQYVALRRILNIPDEGFKVVNPKLKKYWYILGLLFFILFIIPLFLAEKDSKNEQLSTQKSTITEKTSR